MIMCVDGKEVARLTEELPTTEDLPSEERIERRKGSRDGVVQEADHRQLTAGLRRSGDCGRRMENRVSRSVKLNGLSGMLAFVCNRDRNRVGRRWPTPADAVDCCV
jgi:hypothetical protein